MKELCRSLEVDCMIVRNLVSESRQRFLTWAQKGRCYFGRTEKRCTTWPLAWWTHENILEFDALYKLMLPFAYMSDNFSSLVAVSQGLKK